MCVCVCVRVRARLTWKQGRSCGQRGASSIPSGSPQGKSPAFVGSRAPLLAAPPLDVGTWPGQDRGYSSLLSCNMHFLDVVKGRKECF